MIDLENVCKNYVPEKAALNHVNIHIDKGEFVFVVGASGSGKTTLIRLLLKEIEPTSGKIMVNGKDIAALSRRQVPYYRRNIGCVFQDFRLLKDRNIYENVAFAQRVISAPEHEIRQNVQKVLEDVGLADKAKCLPGQLSGGEQQRAAIARALVNQPSILLADEPTGNLDEKNAWEIMKLADQINQKGTTVLVVTHNLGIVKKMKKRVIKLHLGEVISDTKAELEE